jgi:DNA modification methylase
MSKELAPSPSQIPQMELRLLSSLPRYAKNARTHSAEQIQLIVGLMKEFGWTNAMLVDKDGIVAGHGRAMAAEAIYAEGGVIKFPNGVDIPRGMAPVMDCTGWSDAQRRAYILADNQSALRAGWDMELLKLELTDLKLEGFEIEMLGFEDLTDLLDPDKLNENDPDVVPDVPEAAFSVMGDQWIMGPHRVRCGDSTNLDDWKALMGGELADIQVCDPPYNVAYESKLAGSIKNDSMSDGAFKEFLLGFYRCSFAVMKPGAAIYVAHADSEGINFRSGLIEAGFQLKTCLMWVKNALVLGRGDFHYRHEPILYGIKPGAKRAWFGGRKQTTVQNMGEGSPFELMPDGRYAVRNGDAVLYVDGASAVEEVPTTLLHYHKPARSAMHPTTKPVALWERLARNNARANDIIIDGFGGSGTTMIAAERLGMCSRLMEYDPRFCDVILARYAAYTGRVPVHAVTGEPFPADVIARLTSSWEKK